MYVFKLDFWEQLEPSWSQWRTEPRLGQLGCGSFCYFSIGELLKLLCQQFLCILINYFVFLFLLLVLCNTFIFNEIQCKSECTQVICNVGRVLPRVFLVFLWRKTSLLQDFCRGFFLFCGSTVFRNRSRRKMSLLQDFCRNIAGT